MIRRVMQVEIEEWDQPGEENQRVRVTIRDPKTGIELYKFYDVAQVWLP